jgi:hypothetical protein
MKNDDDGFLRKINPEQGYDLGSGTIETYGWDR